MRTTIRSKRFLLAAVLATVLAAGLVVVLAGTRPAQAAFPGTNGKITFASDRDGNSEIYAMNADGTGQTNLTNNPAIDTTPAFSPDGTKIAFMSFRDNNPEIYVMNADGTVQTNLTNNPAIDTTPAFSPDGTKIAFRSFRDSNADIYAMNADGSEQTRLTNNPALDSNPDWGPLAASPANTPPVAKDDPDTPDDPSYTTNEGSPLTVLAADGVLANDTDGDGDPLTVADNDTSDADIDPVIGPSNGTLTLNADGSFDYTPGAGFSGTDSFTYKANDGTDDSDAAMVTITVNDGCTITGSPGPDTIIGCPGNDTISGLAGDDRLSGLADNDTISGGNDNDTISGDSGNDRITGDSGNDRINGGSGMDIISGGTGTDTISVRDGQRDRINCGSGRDRVIADRIDRVSSNCERVSRR